MTSSRPTTCPDDNAVTAFVERGVGDEVRAHIEQCADCRKLVAELTRARASLAQTSPSAGPERPLEQAQRVGRFQVLDVLGRGAMGVVYSAYDPQLERRVALKLLHVGATGGEATERLVREARAAAALAHANVVTVYDVGTHDGEVFVAMEAVDGGNLRQWLKAGERGWREVLDVFVQAGRGLAAAHAAGWIHRDFKPENVLMSRSGRAVVSDFGLARTDASWRPEASAGGQPVSATLTRTGGLLGTPAYMAPEHALEGKASAASDQFSFCVSLYEALHGQRPFGGDSYSELVENLRAGRRVETKAGREVPRWLQRVLDRGLEAEPSKRWPSLDALLAEIARHSGRRLRRTAVAAAAAAVLVAAGAAAFQGQLRTQRLCAAGPQRWDGVWDEAKRRAVHDAFAAAHPGLGESTFGQVARQLDAHAAAWSAQYQESCEATHLRGEQSEALLDRRTACLQERLVEARALVTVFADADRKVVERATSALGTLAPVSRCSAAQVLETDAPPAEPRARAAYDALYAKLADATALFVSGRLKPASDALDAVVKEARALGHKGLLAEALKRQARGHMALDGWDEAAASFEEALATALAAKADLSAAELAIDLVAAKARQKKFDAAATWGRVARGLLDRRAPILSLESQLEYELGVLARAQERPQEARAHYERAREHAVAMGDDGRASQARALAELGNLAYSAGDVRGSLALYEQVHTLLVAEDGPGHPRVGLIVYNMASNYRMLGDYAGAHRALDDAERIWAKAAGPDSPMMESIHGSRSQTFLQEQKLDEALAAAQKQLALRQARVGPEHRLVAMSLINVAEVEVELGRAKEALAHQQEALRLFEREGAERETAYARQGVGGALVKLGRAAEAIPVLEKTLADRLRVDPNPRLAAESRFVLATALWAAGKDRARALALAKQARDAYTEPTGFDAGQREAIDTWLAERRPR